MSIRAERIQESIKSIASEIIVRYAQENEHDYGVVSVSGAQLSPDWQYISIFITSQYNSQSLPKFLAPTMHIIRKNITSRFGLRKIPIIRIYNTKTSSQKKDILQIIQELDVQYGLSQQD